MGLTPVDGLPMGTRSGTLDPGVVLYLMQHEGMDAQAIEQLIYMRSGLLGVSGLSSDMRTLLASDLPAAQEAIDLFVYRIGRELGSLVGRARRARCPGVYRRHRRARPADTLARLPGGALDRDHARRGRQCQGRPAHLAPGLSALGLGDTDR